MDYLFGLFTITKHLGVYISIAPPECCSEVLGASRIMSKRIERQPGLRPIEAPRAWVSGREYEQESTKFLHAAHRFIGRGQLESDWCVSQRLLMRLAYVIENTGWTEDWTKTLQRMLKLAEKSPTNSERRWLTVRAIHAAGAAWKMPKWQESFETRRRCLTHLVNTLESLDHVFALLRHDLDEVATKLDAYREDAPAGTGAKSAERIIAEIILEGADALGFIVEPRELTEAEIRRIQRQLERDVAAHAHRARSMAKGFERQAHM